MNLDHRLRPALKGLSLSSAILGASLVLGSTSALADACTDLGSCVVFEDECWCEFDSPASGAETCGHPAGYTGTYYSLSGKESEHGCEDEADHNGGGVCPTFAGATVGGRAGQIMTLLGVDPLRSDCEGLGGCEFDCATNTMVLGGTGTGLSCWDNAARWDRTNGGYVRCANVEVELVLQEALDESDANLGQCSSDLGTSQGNFTLCTTDLDTAEGQLVDADGDSVPDPRDACEASASGAEVDARGCDQTQFCAAFDASQKDGRKACNKADWQNDEPTQKKKERDCSIAKNGKGKADDTCVPAL